MRNKQALILRVAEQQDIPGQQQIRQALVLLEQDDHQFALDGGLERGLAALLGPEQQVEQRGQRLPGLRSVLLALVEQHLDQLQ